MVRLSPIRSVAPSSVRHTVVNSLEPMQVDSDQKSTISVAQLGRCLERRGGWQHVKTTGEAQQRQGETWVAQENAKEKDGSGESARIGAQCGWNRQWSAGDIRGGAAGPEYTSGASIRYLHRRFAPTCQLAAGMWRHHGGDGIDGRLLDSTVRPSGGARIKTLLSECAAHEERAGTAYGLARMSVASIPAFRGFVAWGFPAGSGRLCDARSGAPPG